MVRAFPDRPGSELQQCVQILKSRYQANPCPRRLSGIDVASVEDDSSEKELARQGVLVVRSIIGADAEHRSVDHVLNEGESDVPKYKRTSHSLRVTHDELDSIR